MSVPQNTLIGKTRQSIGNVTFTTWKGINVMKSKPVSVANPNTQGQVSQRQMLANFVKLFRLNSAIFNAGFKQQAVKKSAYNAACSTNLKNGSISDVEGNPITALSLLEVSKGSLYPTEFTSVLPEVSPNQIAVNYPTSTIADQLNSDKACVTVYDQDGNCAAASIGDATRADGGLIVTPNRQLVLGEPIYIYLFFTQSLTGKVSDNTATTTTVAA